jgi:hypothetical protein
MSKIKGFCTLITKGEETNANVNKLTVGKKYGYEKELIPDAGFFGYSVIDGATVIKLKQSSFETYFREIEDNPPLSAPPEHKYQPNISGPKKDTELQRDPQEVKMVAFDLSGWNKVRDMIVSITLTPANGNKLDVLIVVKPDISFTLFGTTEEVCMTMLPQIAELASVKAKIADLQLIIEQRIAAEKKLVEDNKKKAEEVKKEAAKLKADPKKDDKKPATTGGSKKPVDTTPAVQTDMFGQALPIETASEEFEETPSTDTTEESWS